VTGNPAGTYNPLLIFGDLGFGKTHLLNAIGNAVLQKSPASNVCYCRAERFMNELINHIRSKKMDVFRRLFRTADVLLIDDISLLMGKPCSQEELFYTLKELLERDKQIVLTSRNFRIFESEWDKNLLSLFKSGHMVEIQPSDTETISKIITSQAEHLGITLTDDVTDFFIENSQGNHHIACEMLIRIEALSKRGREPIDLDGAREHLKMYLQSCHRYYANVRYWNSNKQDTLLACDMSDAGWR
jgi:chromosomal replication initiator protein